jgi:hypothetical protein
MKLEGHRRLAPVADHCVSCISSMNSHHNRELRRGNKALDNLLTHYQPMDDKLRTLTDSLARLADGLYGYARKTARLLLRSHTPNPFVRAGRGLAGLVSGSSPTKETTLANCIFDLQLTVFFTETSKFLGNNETASVLVDALLYQATRCETDSPSWEELHDLGTQNTRGIQKYALARKDMPHIGDIEGWTFAKEFGAVVYGTTNNIANTLSIAPLSLVARVRARWIIRYVLWGTMPTKEDEEALQVLAKNDQKKLQELIDSFPQNQDA